MPRENALLVKEFMSGECISTPLVIILSVVACTCMNVTRISVNNIIIKCSLLKLLCGFRSKLTQKKLKILK